MNIEYGMCQMHLTSHQMQFDSAINLWVWAIALHGRDTCPFWQLIIACKGLNGVFYPVRVN